MNATSVCVHVFRKMPQLNSSCELYCLLFLNICDKVDIFPKIIAVKNVGLCSYHVIQQYDLLFVFFER